MKWALSISLSLLIFLTSIQNALILIDYSINRDFYESACINKFKPDLQCNGKCQVKKEAGKNAPQNELTKVNIEFNVIFHTIVEIPKPDFKFSKREKKSFYPSIEDVKSGFLEIFPHPPQQLV